MNKKQILLIIIYVYGYMISSPAARNSWREILLNEPIGHFGSIFLIRKFQTQEPPYVKD